ncbi:cold-shock protein [Mucilaginibacter antarcticus]|uniref:Cold-shock protein n=1 Tax=Mucilaginibacter antarcticus TaxID=1855725 RepID=A0ABW5XQP0_9SPHI
MGRSNETFNKKEKEKKRLKKHQEKKEKAEDRKANSDKGKGLEDMMAYIDADGNITSTPPDGVPRKQVSLEDVRISTPKQIDEPEDAVKTGIISFYNTSKGFGFIAEDKSRENIFFHVNNLTFQAKEGNKVTFSTEKGPKGLVALNIEMAK